MSNVNLIINNKYSTDCNTLLYGELEVIVPSPTSIHHPPLCDLVDKNIVLDTHTYKLFKDLFCKSPVHSENITIYDQNGFILSKYLSNRTNNNSGTVDVTTEPKSMIADIVIPTNDISPVVTILVLTSYKGLSSCNFYENKERTVSIDMKNLRSKYDLSKVILFITDTIYTELTTFYDFHKEFIKVFNRVHIMAFDKIVPSLVEYIAGTVVSGSKPDFQGILNFGENVQVTTAHFSDIKNHMTTNIRGNNRIHFTSTNTISRSYFVIMLYHSNRDDVKITESTTHTEYEFLCENDESGNMSIMMNGLLFMDLLNSFKDHDAVRRYVQTDPINTVLYLFNSPFKSYKHNYTVTTINDMLGNYMYDLDNTITKHLLAVINDSPPQIPQLPQYGYKVHSPFKNYACERQTSVYMPPNAFDA